MSEDQDNIIEMPRYKCHKEVRALKIAEIRKDSDAAKAEGRETDGSAIIVPLEEGHSAFKADHEYMSKHRPYVGGYYVVYEDGYQSFSPPVAFENGYTKIEE